MILYVGRRIAVGLVLLMLVLTMVFTALHLLPGDPATQILASDGATPSPEAIAELRARLGLDEPVLSQYWDFVRGFFVGDLGRSYVHDTSVTSEIFTRFPRTLELVLLTTLMSVLIGVVLGALAARFRGWIESLVTTLASIGVAIPPFVGASALIFFLSLQARIFPAGGYADWSDDPGKHIMVLILPAVSLAIGFSAIVARMTYAAVLDVQHQDFVRTATSLGLSPGRVFVRHVLRNSLTPVATVIGLHFGLLIGGAVLVERVFNFPGLSSLLIDSIVQRDYPVVQGIVIITAASVIIINILVDILYGFLDPKVRLS